MLTEPEPARRVISILDADPELGTGLQNDELAQLRRRAIAVVIELEPPNWDPTRITEQANQDWLGLFLVDGLLIRHVTVGKRPACELFGPGDLIRPWDSDGEYYPLPISVHWHVLRATRLAVLDGAFALRVARWPTLTSRIVARVAQRARYLALIQAATHLPRASARLLILFWLLAERWGTTGRDGVHITLPLTHEVLGMLAGTHRPTVTLALQRLSRAGLLIREGPDRWLLTNLAVDRLGEPESLDLIEPSEDRLPDF